MNRKEIDITKLSPMMKEYIKTKNEYEDVILFYRLGDFYEMFFEDAEVASHVLELTLTGKNAGLSERVPMCGVPHHALNTYLDKLIDKGYKVAICEQMEDPKEAKGIVKREVIQVVSKGTVTSLENISENDFNYIASVEEHPFSYALTYADLLSGKIYTTYVSKNQEKLISYLINLGIKEIVVKPTFNKELIYKLKTNYNIFISYFEEVDLNNNYKEILKNVEDQKLIDNTKLLISYLEKSQKKSLDHLQVLEYVDNKLFLELDKECIRNLELIETLRGKEKTYSLYWLLDKTKTAMGSRMLKSFIISPSVEIEEINKRHDLIELLNKEFLMKSELKEFLYQIYDLERLTGKVVCGSLNGRDLLQLKSSIRIIPDINQILKTLNLEELEEFKDLYELLDASIDEDAPVTVKEGGVIKPSFNKDLEELKLIKSSGKEFLNKFETEERERTGIKNLKIGYNKVFGYYIEISKGQVSLLKDEFGYERRQTISNSERFITPVLKEKEDLIINADDKIKSLEYQIFNQIKEEVKTNIHKLQSVAKKIAYYDVIQSLSCVSEENNFVRPSILKTREVEIIGGRHPVVEHVIKDEYISNDVIFSESENTLLITGPNMSGKSTYMRQFAIIVILNQIGCFVPATSAKLPIFDKIFTRIGASDDLVGGESTFMVEMKESAYALKNATQNSLILFDELGRGTSTYDGMCLASAIIKYISENVKCKTMFSTHYHELTSLKSEIEGIKNLYVSAIEEGEEIKFLHKVKEGEVSKSYGIGVARLALLPEEVIINAKKLLNTYENMPKEKKTEQIKLDLEEEKRDNLREFIKSINPLEITPIEAMNLLDELKRKVEKE